MTSSPLHWHPCRLWPHVSSGTAPQPRSSGRPGCCLGMSSPPPPPTPRDSKLIQPLSSLSEFSISRSGIVYILRVYTERTIIPNLKDMVWPGTVLELLNDFLKGRLYFLTNLRYFSLGST